MKRPVIWSKSALEDLKAQIAYVAAENPAAARHVADVIGHTVTSLAEFPIGRPGRVVNTYEKSVTRLPYIIAYAITSSPTGEAIAVLRVIHTSRDWPKGRWPKP